MAGETPTQFNVAQAAEGLVSDAAKLVADAITTGPVSGATIADATVLVADGITFTQQEANAILGRIFAWEQKNGGSIITWIEGVISKL
jgi:hypothetical protein